MEVEIIHEPILVLVGPTAIGKTDLSLTLAKLHSCEIVSVDSMQVYKYMDIGTAKASVEERSEIPHHLIDIVEPDEDYDAVRFARDALQLIRDIHARGKVPLLTGGTGLYLRALLEGIFPGVVADAEIRVKLKGRLLVEGASKMHEELCLCDCISGKLIHVNDTQRLLRALEVFHASGIPLSEHLKEHREQSKSVSFANILQIGLTCEREKLYQRINQRCESMLEDGLEEEVRGLLGRGYEPGLKSFGSIGYRHMINYINGQWSREELIRLLSRDTRRYAKRQYTWFTKMTELHWFEVSEKEKILKKVNDWLDDNNLDPI
jgi:tRNA dimethylallyltransferase